MSNSKTNQLRIRTGVLKRYVKEKQFYEKELEQEKERLAKMREQNKDEHEINKQEQVINETVMLLPDCQKRITTAYNDLKILVELAKEDPDLSQDEMLQAAIALLEEVKIP